MKFTLQEQFRKLNVVHIVDFPVPVSTLRGPVARMLFAECDPFHTDMAKARFRSPFFLVLVFWSQMVTLVAMALRCCPRQVVSKAHLEMKNSAFYGNNGHFDNEIDLSSNIEPRRYFRLPLGVIVPVFSPTGTRSTTRRKSAMRKL